MDETQKCTFKNEIKTIVDRKAKLLKTQSIKAYHR
jgi:hypothetical protein